MLLHHTAYLMAAPGVQPVLAALYQVRHCAARHTLTCVCESERRSPCSHSREVRLRCCFTTEQLGIVGCWCCKGVGYEVCDKAVRPGWQRYASTTGSHAQVIEARVALQRPLASLAGRLDLLVAHMPQPGAAAAGEDDVAAPLVNHPGI